MQEKNKAFIYGQHTNDLFSLCRSTCDNPTRIEKRYIYPVFHKLRLYPSKSQVVEMLQTAADCSNQRSVEYLTFGQFCTFASELSKSYKSEETRLPNSIICNNKNTTAGACAISRPSSLSCSIFLGGSCNPTTWRQDIAIPMLKNLGITYYNPQVQHWSPELIAAENEAKDAAKVLFFVIDSQTRSTAAIVEAAYIAGSARQLVLVIKQIEKTSFKVMGEAISDEEYVDLHRGQNVLHDLVERQKLPVFDDLPVALRCAAKLVAVNMDIRKLSVADHALPVERPHVQLSHSLTRLRDVFNDLDTSEIGYLNLSDACLAFRMLLNRNLRNDEIRSILKVHGGDSGRIAMDSSANGLDFDMLQEDVGINFEEFCSLVAEFSHGGSTILSSAIDILRMLTAAFFEPLRYVLELLLPPWVGKLFTVTSGRVVVANATRDVYLGGSYDNSAWREMFAIPVLKKFGLSYADPRCIKYYDRLLPSQFSALDHSRVLLFVITDQSRSLTSTAIAAHYIGQGCKVVLCIQYLPDNCIIGKDSLSATAVKDYNRGRMYLSNLATKQSIPVFENIGEAVEKAAEFAIKAKAKQ